MPRSRKTTPFVERLDTIAAALAGFDYGVDSDDFTLYELDRLIGEDRASFDDPDFRQLIDEGVRTHIEENIDIRAQLAGKLRTAAGTMNPETRTVAMRVVRALEDLEADLRNVGVLTRTYTSYLLERLQNAEPDSPGEENARKEVARWRNAEILREELVTKLTDIGKPAVGPTADLLFESIEDRMAVEAAIAVLSQIRSPVGARVLAHIVAEPLLDEDLEVKAFLALRSFWPLPRHYLLYNLHGHAHEDIPFRWYQLFVEVDELTTVDLALEELRAHGDKPNYREDLSALLDVLQGCRDPETEDKVLGAINSPAMPAETLPLLQKFLQEYRKPQGVPEAWSRQTAAYELNRKYVSAAKLFDAGRLDEARKALDGVLAIDSNYPLAAMLRSLTPLLS